MPVCRIKQNYDNTSRWVIGDVVDITNPTQLIKEGKVVLLNERGEEIAPPGTPMKCPICIYQAKDPIDLANHILGNHSGKPTDPPKTADAVRQKRIDNLEKARAARKLNQLKENVKKQEKEAQAALEEALAATKG
jgi:hypothetical protein